MSTVIETFTSEALAKNQTGTIHIDNGATDWWFMQLRQGAVRMIFGDYNIKDKNDVPFLIDKPKLCAVATDDTVYLIDKYLFRLPHGEEGHYPDGMVLFADAKNAITEAAITNVFPDWLEALTPADISERDDARCLRAARETILFGTPHEKPSSKYDMSEKDYIRVLAGFITAEDVILDYLHNDSITSGYAWQKLQYIETEKLIAKPEETTQEYERVMGAALAELNAVSVSVEFEHDGARGSEKMELSRLRNILLCSDRIDAYDFVNKKAAERLFTSLFGTYTYETRLTTADITKITYCKKTVYERADG